MRSAVAFFVFSVVVVAFFGVSRLLPEDSTTRSTVADAVERFRAATRGAGGLDRERPGVPLAGVYAYRTKGTASVETAVANSGRTYSGISTIAVTPSRCGYRARWQVLEERWTEEALCVSRSSTRVAAVREFHEFFEESRTTELACRGGSRRPASSLRAGMRWVTRCASADAVAVSSARVRGVERVAVGGVRIAAVHVHEDISLRGVTQGTARVDSWTRRSDGLSLRKVSRTEGHDDEEDGDMRESFELNLASVEPRR